MGGGVGVGMGVGGQQAEVSAAFMNRVTSRDANRVPLMVAFRASTVYSLFSWGDFQMHEACF